MKIGKSIIISILLIILILIVFPVFGCKTDSTAVEPQGYNNDFTLIDLEGNTVSLHDFKGKIVVINFWTTWCPPCQAEIPDFVEVHNEYKDKRVQFLGISNDFDKSLIAFSQQYKIEYPTLLDRDEKIFSKWKIDAIPQTFILNGNGEIIFEQRGMMKKDQLVNALETALKQD